MQNSTDTTAQLFGRVEIRERGTPDDYGTICDDMWTKQDALVICRMLNTRYACLCVMQYVFFRQYFSTWVLIEPMFL